MTPMSKRVKDLTGLTFGRLTVERFNGTHPTRQQAQWMCLCECGECISVPSGRLLSGDTKSCGCYHVDQTVKACATHGDTHSPTYNIWAGIKSRCFLKTSPSWRKYGMRGITMCERWVNSYQNFLEDMGERPSSGHSIDRIDNNGNYEPSNCRWATAKDQANNRRSNTWITLDGVTLTIAQWSERLGLHQVTMCRRIARGLDAKNILRQGRATV